MLALKGAWVLWMLHNELGREPMLAALRDLVGRHSASGIEATPADLLAALTAQADDPTAFRASASQWLDEIVLPEFALSGAIVQRTATGWRAQATVRIVGTGTATVEVGATGRGALPRGWQSERSGS